MDLAAHLKARAETIEAALDRLVPPADAEPARLHQAMRYSLEAGGKRLRPALVLDACAGVGGDAEACLPTACAFECIHTYSLIHDDLPCMDDDDLRRGRPSCHKQFDEATALLAGDALLTLAFTLTASNATSLGAERANAATAVLAEAAGAAGMVGGQMIDLLSEGVAPSAELVETIHLKKTTALLRGAVVAGAVLGGASAAQVTALSRYGTCLGLSFQIIDDILDIVGDEAKLGKPVGSDEGHAKATWPAVMGIDASRRRAAELCEEALGALTEFGVEAEPLRALARYVVERDR
jgi:geranylgeranyl diphosphate synthase type II